MIKILILSLSVLLLLVLSLILGYMIYPTLNHPINHNLGIETNCTQYNFKKNVECVRDEVKEFYNYVQRNESSYTGNQGSLEDIKLNGGDCYDYTMIYNQTFYNQGYQTKKVNIYDENYTSGHTFILVYDKGLTEFCKVDLLNVNCWEFT